MDHILGGSETMAGGGDGAGNDWFDLARIKQLVRLMRDNEMSEIDLQWEEGKRLRLRRGSLTPVLSTVQAAPVAASAPTTARAASVEAAGSPSTEKATFTEIKSPIVGTFYSASGPDSEPFVKVGSRVSSDTTVCIVEAMKVFNEIPAGVSGTIRELLVENGAPVEYGQPIFRVDPS